MNTNFAIIRQIEAISRAALRDDDLNTEELLAISDRLHDVAHEIGNTVMQRELKRRRETSIEE